jgi:hypothetical protein
MGFEYKLKTKLTDKQTTEIQGLLIDSITFDKKHKFDGKEFWDYKRADNIGKMPSINIIFEEDGIYICQYGSSYLWTDIEKLKDYLDNEKIEYKIIDYQD